MIAILGTIWPFLVGGAAVLWGIFKHFQANAKIATAGQQVAQAQTAVAQAQTQVANAQNAEAQANATAAQAGADSLKEKVNVTNDVSALPAGSAASELRDEWSKD